MILKDHFFTLLSRVGDSASDTLAFTLRLNADHPIYGDHFPGNPVTPGVCMIQIVKELIEEVLGKPVFLPHITRVRYLAIINPDETPEINISLKLHPGDNTSGQAEASFFKSDREFARCTLRWQDDH